MTRLLLSAVTFIGLASVGHAQTGWSWFDNDVLKRIQVSGERRLGYHVHQVRGDFEAYSSLNYQGEGGSRFTDSGSMSMSGTRVGGLLNFQVSFSANRFADPQQQRLTLSFDRGPYSFGAGDVVGRLTNSNSLMSFGRSLKGVTAGFTSGRVATRVLHSETKGTARTVTIEGANSLGPYFLQSGRLLEDSVSVRVDGVDQVLLRDYVLDYDLGTLTFVDKVIPPTSTIMVTYETFGFNTERGTIQGGGITYDLGPFGRVGLTGIQQTGQGTRGVNARTELFQGFGDPAIPYFLQFRPTPGTVNIKVNGIDQVLGADYVFDPTNSQVFYFRRFMPSNLTITVTYRPIAEQTLDGDRRAWGLDYRIPLGKGGTKYLQYNQSSGELLNESNPLSATARSIDLRWQDDRWSILGSAKDIPPDYVTVESRGFNRNERSTSLSVERLSERYSYGASVRNSAISSRVASGSAITFRPSRSTEAEAFARYTTTQGTSWSLTQNRRTSRSSRASTLDSTELTLSRQFSPFVRGRFSLESQTGRGPITLNNAIEEGRIELGTLKANLSYNPYPAFVLSTRASVTQTRAAGESAVGNDVAVSASYQGDGRWSGSATYQISRAGKLANLGFDNGTGSGFADSGFNSGALGDGSFGVGGTNARRVSISTSYQATSRLALRTTLFDTEARGSLTANARSTGIDFGAQWDLGRTHALDVGLNLNRTRFLQTATDSKSDSTVFDFFFSGAPNRWNYSLGFNALVSGSRTQFSSDAIGLAGGLGYRLDARRLVGLSAQWGRTRGYYPQDDRFLSAFYRQRIWETLSLEASYKWRDVQNLDGLISGGSYRSNGFDLELLFDFSGRLFAP